MTGKSRRSPARTVLRATPPLATAERLARRALAYISKDGKRPEPDMECDCEMFDLATELVSQLTPHVVKGWAVWHPVKGFDAYAYEGAIAFADVSDDLVEMVKNLNETDGTNKRSGWRAVAVNVTLADPMPQVSLETSL